MFSYKEQNTLEIFQAGSAKLALKKLVPTFWSAVVQWQLVSSCLVGLGQDGLLEPLRVSLLITPTATHGFT